MTESNFENRTLFHGDNLDFLRGMNSASVDLIATDPPFKSPFTSWQDIARAGLPAPRKREHTIKRQEFTSRTKGKL